MKTAVIGAGPAGLAAAYQLVKAGVSVEVFEAGPSVGGLARTIELWGQKADLGPHRFFSRDERVNALWKGIVGEDYSIVRRQTRILYEGRFYSYPLEPFDALKNLGLARSAGCLASFFKEMVLPTRQDGSFENWVVRHFGRRLFETFFRSYSEKLWGIPCKDIDADFAAQRIRKLSLYQAVKHAFFKDRTGKHRTLTDSFAYPHGGTGMVYERMAARIRRAGGVVHCNNAVQRVVLSGKKVTGLVLADGRDLAFDRVVSTMPLTALVSRLPDADAELAAAAGGLDFRNTVFVYLNVPSGDLFPDQWIYLQSPELKAGRVTNFRNWVPQLYGKEKNSILAVEYWCGHGDPLWTKSDKTLAELAVEELSLAGFDRSLFEGCDSHIERSARSYPVYRRGYKEKVAVIRRHLSGIEGLAVIGRYGAFKYNNQDHSILMGILAAENITHGAGHDLWAVNNDYEEYQESGAIRRAGLVR